MGRYFVVIVLFLKVVPVPLGFRRPSHHGHGQHSRTHSSLEPTGKETTEPDARSA